MSESPRRRVTPVFTPPGAADPAPANKPIPIPSVVSSEPAADPSWRWTIAQILAPIFLLLAVFTIDVIAMPNSFWVGDPFAWREETRSILRDHHLWVDENLAKNFGENGQYFVLNEKDGHWYSKYGVVNSVM